MQDTTASQQAASKPQLEGPLYFIDGVTYTGEQYEALMHYGRIEDYHHQMVPPGAFLAYLETLASLDSPTDPIMCNGAAWLTQFLIDKTGILWRAFAEGLQAVHVGGQPRSPLIPYGTFERHILALPLCNVPLARQHVLAWQEAHCAEAASDTTAADAA